MKTLFSFLMLVSFCLNQQAMANLSNNADSATLKSSTTSKPIAHKWSYGMGFLIGNCYGLEDDNTFNELYFGGYSQNEIGNYLDYSLILQNQFENNRYKINLLFDIGFNHRKNGLLNSRYRGYSYDPYTVLEIFPFISLTITKSIIKTRLVNIHFGAGWYQQLQNKTYSDILTQREKLSTVSCPKIGWYNELKIDNKKNSKNLVFLTINVEKLFPNLYFTNHLGNQQEIKFAHNAFYLSIGLKFKIN